MVNGYIDLSSARCEARVRGYDGFEPCGRPAHAIIEHVKDRCLRAMCRSCAMQHIGSRGGKVIAATIEFSERFLQAKPAVLSRRATGANAQADEQLGAAA
jgi:hypothetical protein